MLFLPFVGEMVQCDKCLFWQHAECVPVLDEDAEYICDQCRGTADWTIPKAVPLKVQPDMKLPGCLYYRSMLKDECLQLRFGKRLCVNQSVCNLWTIANASGECVYVQRIESLSESQRYLLRSLNRDIVQPSLAAENSSSDDLNSSNNQSPTATSPASSSKVGAVVTFPDGSKGIKRDELRIFRIERLFEVME